MRRSPGLAGGEQCPATVPGCAAAEFCAPSLPADYAPAGSYRNSSAACLPGCHDAGKLDGQLVCMQCFGGHSHSRFYTMAVSDVGLSASPPYTVAGLAFGALVRTAPFIDRVWSNIGIGFKSAFLTQANVSRLRFHLRPGGESSYVGLNPPTSSFSSLPSGPFNSLPGNRYVPAALAVGPVSVGHAEFLVDTGNPGISIQSETLAAALAAATGGVWEGGKHGGLRLKTGAAAARPITVSAGEIRVVLPGRYGPALILGGGL